MGRGRQTVNLNLEDNCPSQTLQKVRATLNIKDITGMLQRGFKQHVDCIWQTCLYTSFKFSIYCGGNFVNRQLRYFYLFFRLEKAEQEQLSVSREKKNLEEKYRDEIEAAKVSLTLYV